MTALFPGGYLLPHSHKAETDKCKSGILEHFSYGEKEVKRMCAILHADFECFPYARPEVCKGMGTPGWEDEEGEEITEPQAGHIGDGNSGALFGLEHGFGNRDGPNLQDRPSGSMSGLPGTDDSSDGAVNSGLEARLDKPAVISNPGEHQWANATTTAPGAAANITAHNSSG